MRYSFETLERKLFLIFVYVKIEYYNVWKFYNVMKYWFEAKDKLFILFFSANGLNFLNEVKMHFLLKSYLKINLKS